MASAAAAAAGGGGARRSAAKEGGERNVAPLFGKVGGRLALWVDRGGRGAPV
eukprot:CAMPEP_0185379472 /NCGR_PEP_ID=MMETSP1364-20130426/47771_1 /TAXON_ID=38817 /ORGANISM="Gephyrocapsa oceanica, Strain RCC1303" /LENGTH=51 /DNA_ID=CAMNT_0027981053 /DNA_START=8 /DNA_END=162 /DNA_ORIENTATION=-